MASGRPIGSAPVNHRVLGPAVSVFDDRRRSFGMIFLYLAFIAISVVGVILGVGDLTGGNDGTATFGIPGPVLGLAQIAAAVIVSAWSIRATIFAIGRIRQPITFVVGRDGFEYVGSHEPVLWDEVVSVNDPASPPGQPRILRVQLADPADFVVRHRLSLIDRYALRVHHNDLYLDNGTIMPVAAVQAAMNERLAEFRRVGPRKVGTSTSAPRTRPRGSRRSSRRG